MQDGGGVPCVRMQSRGVLTSPRTSVVASVFPPPRPLHCFSFFCRVGGCVGFLELPELNGWRADRTSKTMCWHTLGSNDTIRLNHGTRTGAQFERCAMSVCVVGCVVVWAIIMQSLIEKNQTQITCRCKPRNMTSTCWLGTKNTTSHQHTQTFSRVWLEEPKWLSTLCFVSA